MKQIYLSKQLFLQNLRNMGEKGSLDHHLPIPKIEGLACHLHTSWLDKTWLAYQPRMQQFLTLIYVACQVMDSSDKVLMKSDHLWKCLCTELYNQKQHKFYLMFALHNLWCGTYQVYLTMMHCSISSHALSPAVHLWNSCI